MTIRSGTRVSCSKLFAQIPMMKPSMLNVSAVRTRNATITPGCWISIGTNTADVARMTPPRMIDLVAAAPT